MASSTVVSAPGKVLLAGGYLVLYPPYAGVVVSTSSRFYTAVSNISAASSDSGPIQVHVRSPQFQAATWSYLVHIDEAAVRLEQSSNGPKNKFVQLALERVLLLALQTKGAAALRQILSTGLDIVIVGDNDFYSQRKTLTEKNLPPTSQSLRSLDKFNDLRIPLSDVHKTGLGSSAALITSLVSSLLLHLSLIPSDSFDTQGGLDSASDGRKFAHNVAQYVHCLAQGKVGSGFDVSAAVFGSQLYTRFNPKVINDLMDEKSTSSLSLFDGLSPSRPQWNHKADPFKLPPLTRLMLADVDAGSDTPSFVGNVLKWREANRSDGKDPWDDLNEKNQALASALSDLSSEYEKDPHEYAVVVKYISSLQSLQWIAHPGLPPRQVELISKFLAVHHHSQAIRKDMREMGNQSGVPIEPPEQEDLLNACTRVAGVVGGGVPGAGGYDAIWVLVLEPEGCGSEQQPSTRVEAVWSSWTKMSVSPLLASESQEKGARVERLQDIPRLTYIVTS